MRTFAPGARVVVRGEEWIVKSTGADILGQASAVRVIGISELVRGKEAIFLTDIDEIEELRPEDTKLVHDATPRYRRSRLYLESLLRRTPPTGPELSVGHTAAMDLAEYQLVPAAKALGQPRPRILIADGVGLGKTLEAGILLSELIRRGRGERILVVALKSILTQFQEEMWARFTIPLVRLDSVGLQRVRAKIPSHMNPFYYYNRVIISVDTLKKDGEYRRFLEGCRWDAIVIDECQNVAVRGRGKGGRSQRARLANLLAETCDALIMTSATPHDGRPESFASLMNLLEPTAVANTSSYSFEDISGLFVRRFKKDVSAAAASNFKERDLDLLRCPASSTENQLFTALDVATFRTVDRARNSRGVLFKTLLVKAALSSPDACAATIEARMKNLEKRGPKEESRRPEDADAEHDWLVLRKLGDLCRAIPKSQFSKLQRLFAELEAAGYRDGRVGDRVVIFSERIPTLKLLQTQLMKRFRLKEEQVALFHGSDDMKQQGLVKDFGTKTGKTRILLGSDAASEGINLHFFCHRMIHFDVPWSLITLEQRNGRIDRFGQTETPWIRYLLTLPDGELRGDLRIIERLVEKEEMAHKNLGDVAWLMKLYDAEAEEERIAQAIQEGVAAETALPDQDLWADDDDWIAMLSDEAESDDTVVTMSVPPTLYGDDLDYARDAFEEIEGDELIPVRPPEWHEMAKGFTLTAPDDLRRRFEYLPRELRNKHWEFKLSSDRDLVQRAYADARQDDTRWPEWQLFWPLHPIAEWLDDRVLQGFGRNEAPILQVPGNLDRGEFCLLFNGVISNRRSQPRIIEWFGLLFDTSGDHSVQEFDELVALAGLKHTLHNPGDTIDGEQYARHIPAGVARAKEHMSAVRDQYEAQVAAAMERELQRVRTWRDRSVADLDAARDAKVAKQGRLKSDQQKKDDDARREVERCVASRERAVIDTLSTVPDPYIRLAAVLVGREG